jgi:large conductance mechanosensitive channel
MVRRSQATGFVADFQKFLMQGNVVDLAVAVVIGGAFGKIVTAFVENLIMPIVALVVPGGEWRNIKIPLSSIPDPKDASKTIENSLLLGQFLGAIVDFVIIAFVIFLVVRALEKMKRKKEAADEAAPPSTEERLVSVLEKMEARM